MDPKVTLMKRVIIFLCIIMLASTTAYAAPDFIGTWTATVNHEGSFDTYEITFSTGNRSTVRISNDNAEQETAGTWFWNGTTLRVNATFRNASIPHQNNIDWNSVATFTAGNNAFSILGRAAVNAPLTRFTFVRQGTVERIDRIPMGNITNVLDQSFNMLLPNIPRHSRLAVVDITNADPRDTDYLINEMTLRFVNSRQFTVIERREIEHIIIEQDFQMSGYVDNEAFVSIGRFLGATVVVSGSIDGVDSRRRLVLRALDVLTAEILSMSSVLLE